jgi:three-Cys-motif partner protein
LPFGRINVAKPIDTLWNIEPHTKAKHEILRRYLGAWFPILGSRISRLNYLDGFCGPGRYTGGEDGSPIIALDTAMSQALLKTSDVNFIFIDERRDRIEHLKSELSSLAIPPNFNVCPIVNEFENTLTKLLDELEQKGATPSPNLRIH